MNEEKVSRVRDMYEIPVPAPTSPKPLFAPAIPPSREESQAIADMTHKIEVERRDLQARLGATPPPLPEDTTPPEPKLSEQMANKRLQLRLEMAAAQCKINELKAAIAADEAATAAQ